MPSQQSGIWRPELEGAVDTFEFDAQRKAMFIGNRVLPFRGEPTFLGQYPVWAKENFRKLQTTERAPNGAFNRGDFDYDFDNYKTVDRGFEEPLDIKTMDAFQTVLDLETEAAIGADYIVAQNLEKRIAAAVMNISTFTATNVAVSWVTIASSTPLVDIDVAANKLADQLGVPRQMLSLILPRTKWQNLRQSATVLNVMKSWGSGISRSEQIRETVITEYLDIKEIIVGQAAYDSADEGQTQSFSQMWPTRYGMLALLASGDSAPRTQLSLGRVFRWTNGMPNPITIETYDEKGTDSHIVRARQFTDEKIQASFAGELLDLTAAS